ncbi:MAG: hypothetical protein LBV33_00175 [Lachnospiraceae bacterium]|jgi:hypothetical protein|nr:hypothetical protein [Lachnospiraceae bacterium]
MNIDFHYYGTYTAARIAGYDQGEAKVIAYAAQYVDEFDKEMLTDSVAFLPVPTIQSNSEVANYYINPLPWTAEQLCDVRRAWMCFHFLPGNFNREILYEGPLTDGSWKFEDFEENEFRLMCRPNSESAVGMINDIEKHKTHQYFYQMIGLRMHVLADTWAHESYVGWPAWHINEVKDEVQEMVGNNWRKVKFSHLQLSDNISGNSYLYMLGGSRYDGVAYLGHGRIGHLPDYGFMKYRYKPVWKENLEGEAAYLVRDNQESFYSAFTQMVHALMCIKNGEVFTPDTYFDLNSEYTNDIKAIFETRVSDQSAKWQDFLTVRFREQLEPFDRRVWRKDYDDCMRKDTMLALTRPYVSFAKAAVHQVDYVEAFLAGKDLKLGYEK